MLIVDLQVQHSCDGKIKIEFFEFFYLNLFLSECPDLVFNFVKQISKDFPEKFSDVVRSDALRVLLGHELYVSYINPHLQNCVLHVELKIV